MSGRAAAPESPKELPVAYLSRDDLRSLLHCDAQDVWAESPRLYERGDVSVPANMVPVYTVPDTLLSLCRRLEDADRRSTETTCPNAPYEYSAAIDALLAHLRAGPSVSQEQP